MASASLSPVDEGAGAADLSPAPPHAASAKTATIDPHAPAPTRDLDCRPIASSVEQEQVDTEMAGPRTRRKPPRAARRGHDEARESPASTHLASAACRLRWRVVDCPGRFHSRLPDRFVGRSVCAPRRSPRIRRENDGRPASGSAIVSGLQWRPGDRMGPRVRRLRRTEVSARLRPFRVPESERAEGRHVVPGQPRPPHQSSTSSTTTRSRATRRPAWRFS